MRLLTIMFLAVLVAGCATSYQREGFSGGFQEVQLDENVFRVSFRGNGYTSLERAEEMALLRSAELTLQKGFTHFAILDARSREQIESYTTPATSTTNATVGGTGRSYSATTTTTGGDTSTYAKPRTTNTIMCFVGRPKIAALVYDAKFLCRTLGEKFEVSCREH
jgi:hypothetical protein